jgi:hypothetical protein
MANVATLTLGSTQTIALPYNPNNVTWNYLLNKQIIDTYGGRVVQILSVATQQMNFIGDAGSRPKLMYLFSQLKQMQTNQIQSKEPATLVIPASFAENGTITQSVYIDTVNLGIDYTTVTHPYQISFQIEDNNVTDQLITNTLKQIASAFNYSSGVGNTVTGQLSLLYQGLDSSNQLSVAQLANAFTTTSTNAEYLITTPTIGTSYGV